MANLTKEERLKRQGENTPDENTEVGAKPKRQMKSIRKNEIPIPEHKKYKPILETDTEGNGIDYYDKCLITVNRISNGQYGITKSITVQEILTQKMPSQQSMIDSLNFSQDWQNAAVGGKPLIMFYFLHGSVEAANEFLANDVYYKEQEGDDDEIFTTDPKQAIKTHGIPKLAQLNVTEKRIEKWLPAKNGKSKYGKPVFAED